jgi:hypothetical protein
MAGDGTFCGHWQEKCLGSELMTGYAGSVNPLSRITIGSLEDLGYTVDYSTADVYGRSNLGVNCTCNRRQRSLLDMYNGETRQLGLGSPNVVRRRLSAAARQIAVDYGRSLLAEQQQQQQQTASVKGVKSSSNTTSAVTYVGDQVVSVIVEDGDSIFSVVVRPL